MIARTFFGALVFSALIELESAGFKGKIAALARGDFGTGLAAAVISVAALGMTIGILLRRLENVGKTAAEKKQWTSDDAVRTTAVVFAALAVLVVSALVHLDETLR